MRMPNVFKPFVSETRRAFDYLVTTYGFRRITEDALGPEAWVVFENSTTRITVHYEMGSAPWVEIGRLENVGGRAVQTNAVGLYLLLEEKGRSLDDELDAPRDISHDELSAMLQARASGLAKVGEELLRGNFESFPRLLKKAERDLRKREAELFGPK